MKRKRRQQKEGGDGVREQEGIASWQQ